MEVEILKKCLEGDRRAQELCYKWCYGKLIGTAYRYANDKEQAVFYFNIGFVKILLNLKQFNPENPFEFWAKRVMINEILNEIKKEKRIQSKVQITDDLSGMSINMVDVHHDQEIQERMELVKEKVKQLPPMTKSVFNLYAIDGYKHNEIASMLGINENTSMWHYSDAKKKIRHMLDLK